MSNDEHSGFLHNIEKSALITIIGIIFLFSFAVGVVLVAPTFIDPTWTNPTTPYQVQMYEVADPHLYIGGGAERQTVYHIQQDHTLLVFQESDLFHIVAPADLEKYITRTSDKKLKLTSRLLMLRPPESSPNFDAKKSSEKLANDLITQWTKDHPNAKEEGTPRPAYTILELYAPTETSAFARITNDGPLENWVAQDFVILDAPKQKYHSDPGVIYVQNPQEFRISTYNVGTQKHWRYDPNGEKISSLEQLKSHPIGFLSRQELIKMGEHIYAIEGCWYCHTDQTRTLIQDVVLNGSDTYPAPPSSANEYIYQNITFPGTRRIGPDISRVGIKRPSRDWHRGHFWSPKTASEGSIMPSFQHFFDNDPRGTGQRNPNLPNYKFEALYQYLMTKGTRITPPTQAWWLGKDPVNTIAIIEGRKEVKKKNKD